MALARLHAQCGRDALAYLLHWKAQGDANDRAEWGARLAERQHEALSAIGGQSLAFEVAFEAEDRGGGPGSVTWRWTAPERAMHVGAPVLALRVLSAATDEDLRIATHGLETLATVELLGWSPERPVEALEGARLVGSLRLSNVRLPADALTRLSERLISLVHVSWGAWDVEHSQLSDTHLRALARFPRLRQVELDLLGFGRPGVMALAGAPCMTWLGVERCELELDVLRDAARSNPRLGIAPTRTHLARLLRNASLAQATRRLLDGHDHADPALRGAIHAASRALLIDRPPLAATRLVGLALDRDPHRDTLRAAGVLAEAGKGQAELLGPLARLARQDDWSGKEARRALKFGAVAGWDLSAVDLEGTFLPTLSAAVQRASPQTRAFLREEAGHKTGGARGVLIELAVRALATGDPRAEPALLACASRGHQALDFLVAVGLAGDRTALAAVEPLLRQGFTLAPAPLARLGEAASQGDAEAGAILWTAARRGHAMAPALAALGATGAWAVTGADAAVSARLVEVGVEERLPPGASRERRHGASDDETTPTEAGRACAVCGSLETICIHHDGFGSNAGGWDEWESKCRVCGHYTYTDREWG